MSGAAVDDATRALRLLIVDDQPLIRRGLAMMLATEPGIEVVGQAADGLEAIEQALATRPDVVVMDLQMPRASGVVATREITARLPATLAATSAASVTSVNTAQPMAAAKCSRGSSPRSEERRAGKEC